MDTAIGIIVKRFLEFDEQPAVYKAGKYWSYRDFYDLIDIWRKRLDDNQVDKGAVCGVQGDFSAETMALFFALMLRKCILVPVTRNVKNFDVIREVSCMEYNFIFSENEDYIFEKYDTDKVNELIIKQREANRSGLIVFSSGSTGVPKGILQDCEHVAEKFRNTRKGWRTILFLLMDHFGGFNTFLSILANGGLAVCVAERKPELICQAIEETKADLLPTTPTFLNLLIASRCYLEYDISSLQMVTYGTEMMNSTTLAKMQEILPYASFKQTYGLSELGVLRSKSKEDGSLWLKVGGSEFKTKIVDNILWIKAQSNMVGYLNAPNPFDEEGWFCTGDEVEQDGEYIHFVGRESEIINVGGQKVFPAEVEAVILEDENVSEVTVLGKKHPVMGQIVCARVTLNDVENKYETINQIRKNCARKLEKYKIPVKFELLDKELQVNDRFKKIRK